MNLNTSNVCAVSAPFFSTSTQQWLSPAEYIREVKARTNPMYQSGQLNRQVVGHVSKLLPAGVKIPG